MTIGAATAYRARAVNPDCEVCEGTGRDVLFDTDCTDCFRLHLPRSPRMEQHLNPSIPRMMRTAFIDTHVEQARENARRRKWRAQSQRAAWKRDHPITMRIIRELVGNG